MKKNDIYTVEITDMVNLGNGVAHIDGKAVFVSGAVDCEVCEIKIIKVLADYALARCERVIKASEHRREPCCPVFGRCGGCTFGIIGIEHENELKRKYVESTFRKSGLSPRVEEVVSSADKGYRCKVEYPFSKNGRIGLYAKRSHEVIEFDSCIRQADRLYEVGVFLDGYFRDAVGRGIYTVYNEESGKGLLRHLYMRYARGTDSVLVCIVINGDSLTGSNELAKELFERFPFVRSFQININKKKTNVVLGDKCVLIKGDEYLEDIICSCRLRFSPLSFCQVNHEGMEMLYEKVRELADIRDGDKVADLYCGVGSIGITAVKGRREVSLTGVEIIPDAVENAKYNAKINGLENARFFCGDADICEVEDADIVIVDPPRKGCGRELIERINEISPRRVVYVSCDPATLARDCKVFDELGYKTDTVYPVNMFPGTGHVESVVCLTRGLDNELRERMN